MSLTYDVFVNDPPAQESVLPNGEPKRFSPMASTLIYFTGRPPRDVDQFAHDYAPAFRN